METLFAISMLYISNIHINILYQISSSQALLKPNSIRKRRISATNNATWAQDDFNFMTIVLMD